MIIRIICDWWRSVEMLRGAKMSFCDFSKTEKAVFGTYDGYYLKIAAYISIHF